MSEGLNKVTLIGNLGTDPETKFEATEIDAPRATRRRHAPGKRT